MTTKETGADFCMKLLAAQATILYPTSSSARRRSTSRRAGGCRAALCCGRDAGSCSSGDKSVIARGGTGNGVVGIRHSVSVLRVRHQQIHDRTRKKGREKLEVLCARRRAPGVSCA
eukprot:1352955-Prymnesium_polylepis.1